MLKLNVIAKQQTRGKVGCVQICLGQQVTDLYLTEKTNMTCPGVLLLERIKKDY